MHEAEETEADIVEGTKAGVVVEHMVATKQVKTTRHQVEDEVLEVEAEADLNKEINFRYNAITFFLSKPPMAADLETSPVLEILVREPDGYSIWNGPPFNNNDQPEIKLEKVPCSSAKFSEDGSRLMVMKADCAISICDSSTLKEIRSFQTPHIASALSPCGTYLQTFHKSTTAQEKNVILWSVETGDPVYQQFQKNMTKATWPSIRFSSDEAVACRLATNEIQFFDPADFSKGTLHWLRIPGVAAVELSRAPRSHVAAFVPESKGSPASVQIYPCEKELQSQPLARRSFFRCSTVQLNWNRGSTGLLVVAQSDVDKTNQSYYGESKLIYLTTDGTFEGLVPLRKEGPIHDVQWSFSGKNFAVVYGCILFCTLKDLTECLTIAWLKLSVFLCKLVRVMFDLADFAKILVLVTLFMPANATIFDKKCKRLLELGSGPYNTVRWNPKGKLLCLAGFGNLPGDMVFLLYPNVVLLLIYLAELSLVFGWFPWIFSSLAFVMQLIFSCMLQAFWDVVDKKQLGTTRAECSVTSEWSADGRYFMTATTAPRLQVDNCIKIFNYNGSLFFTKMFDKLFQADWKPESPEKFGEIAELVKSVDSIKVGETKSQGQGSTSKKPAPANPPAKKPAPANPPAKKPAPANPPAKKPAAYRPPHAKNAAAVQAELFGGSTTGETSKNALKNKNKREKQKEKKAVSGAT
ncbi:hypothetical protein GQ457_01G035020 [Hibiscus cannabinus]